MNRLEFVFDVEERRRRVYRRNFDRNLSAFGFKEAFRLSTPQFEFVYQEIGETLRPQTERNRALSVEEKILASLHWMGTGCQYHAVSAMHGPAKSSVCRSLHEVVTAIVNLLFQRTVRWPDDVAEIAIEFLRKGGFPSVCGCVDGTMVTIDAPTLNEDQFVNRHNKHALNVMAICGPDYRFYAVNASWPGSVHDSRVFRNTAIYKKFDEENWRPFPDAVILGDSAYRLKEWLIPPRLRNPEDPAERRFLRIHKRTRRIIENSFGILKEKFPCLNHMRLAPQFAGMVVLACTTLHNIALTIDRDVQGIPHDGSIEGGGEEEEEEDDEEEVDNPDEADYEEEERNNAGERRLTRLLNYFR